MKLLLDTHLLLWSALRTARLSPTAKLLLESPENRLYYSAAAIWEIAVKKSQGKSSFQVDALEFRELLNRNSFEELSIDASHGAYVQNLPLIHKNPFDRILIAQATIEGITLLTSDRRLATYPGPIQLV
jgi:PIN domain nuclease of toxin-antitoxin system